MKIEARIIEVSVPTNDKYICKIAYKVNYRAIDREGNVTRWFFHSIYADRDIAEYVKNGIEDNSIPVLYERPLR